MSDTSLVFNAIGRDRGVNALLQRTAATVKATNLAGAASTVALGAALGSAASYAVALTTAAAGAVGAVALLPAALAATAATVLAGKAATFGFGDAWTATAAATTAGGAAAAATAARVTAAQRRVESATQALTDSQRSALDAQLALTRARVDETERISDLARAVTGAALDEEGAVRAVAKAKQELQDAQNDGLGDVDRISEADYAYRQAQQTLADVRDRVSDLGKEQTEARQKGVEGSDAVQSALRQQEETQRAVVDAARDLVDAQTAVTEASAAAAGGVDKAAEALARLSPAGRDVILTLRGLVPAWEAAARGAQQNTFRGVAGDLRALSALYLPGVERWLGRMGSAFNTAIRQTAGLAQTRGFVADVDTVLSSTAATTDRLARAVRPVINGLMQWAAVGAQFLPGFGDGVLSVAERFERWSTAARESGQMQEWMSRGVEVLGQLGSIARDVVMSVVAIFRAGDDGGSTLDSLERGAAAMRGWLESAQGQETVSKVFETLRNVIGGLATGLQNADGPADTLFDSLSVGGVVVEFLANHTDTLGKALPWLAAGFIVLKTAQVASNVAAVASLPIQVAQTAANWRLGSALQAQTAALAANKIATAGSTAATAAGTVATTAGDTAQKRSVASAIAARVATLAGAAAAGIATAAQWALNLAMSANPIGLIILGIMLLIGVIVLIATKTTWFQTAWGWAWGGIKAAASAVGTWFKDVLWGQWIVGSFNGIVDAGGRALGWFESMRERLRKALSTVGDILMAPFKWGFNQIAQLWNNGVGRLSFTVPSWVPGFGGAGFEMPDIPYLAKGGNITAAGLAVVGDGGEPEVVHLPAGASVTPMSQVRQASGGGHAVLELAGEREIVAFLRRLIKQYRLMEA